MAFIEVSLPEELAWGATGGPEWSTEIFQPLGGDEQRNQNRAHPLGRWDLGLVNKDATYTRLLLNFFNSVAKGKANGFRFRDLPNDYWQAVEEFTGIGDGVLTQFQLYKEHPYPGVDDYNKPIYKPVAGTVSIFFDGAPQLLGWTVSTITGIVTFASPVPDEVIITASYEFELPVRFDIDHFACTRIDPDIFTWPSIPLVELRRAT